MPFEMIKDLWTKISKITNRDKEQLKMEVFIKWELAQVLSACFKQIDKVHAQLAKWNTKCQRTIKYMNQIGSPRKQ